MTEIFTFLCCVSVLALVGHAIWMCGVFLLRLVMGQTGDNRTASSRPLTPTPGGDLLQADECVQRLTRGQILQYEAYEIVREKLEEAARLAGVQLSERWSNRAVDLQSGATPPRVADGLSSNASVVRGLDLQVAPARVHVPLGKRDEPFERQSNAAHALDKDYSQAEVTRAGKLTESGRHAVGEMLQQFLNEKNIHWGELLSGVLIVGSAGGLILSLRTQLSQIIPMFPAVLFFLVTAAIHFAGFYTLSRWKLPSTSRGLLLIGSLLLPLTCLATALLADHRGRASILEPSFIALLLAGGGACATLVYYGGKHLFPSQPMTWTIGIMGSSLAQGFINRAASGSSDPVRLSAIGCLTLIGLAYVVTRVAIVPRFSGSIATATATTLPTLVRQWKLYGVTFFSLAIALGLLVFRVDDHFDSWLPLAVPLATLGLLTSTIGCGLASERGIKQWNISESNPGEIAELSQWNQVSSSAIVMLGGVLAIGATFIAKDHLLLVIAIALASGLVGSGLAYLFQNSTMTALSVAGLSGGSLLLAHFLSGNLAAGPLSATDMASVCAHGLTGLMLLVEAIACGIGGRWLRSREAVHRSVNIKISANSTLSAFDLLTHGQVMFWSAGLLALLAIADSCFVAVTSTSLPSMGPALTVLVCCAGAGMVAGFFRNEILPVVFGSGLALVACATLVRVDNPIGIWLGVANWATPWRILVALMLHAVATSAARLLLAAWPIAQIPKQPVTMLNLEHAPTSAQADPPVPADASMAPRALGLTAAVTAAASIPLLVRWDELHNLGPLSMCLIVVGIVCVVHGRLDRVSTWRIVGQAALGMAAAQLLAILLGTIAGGSFALEQCLICAVSVVGFAWSFLASAPAVARSSHPALTAWRRIDADVVCVAFLAYLLALATRFWNTPGASFTPNAWLFAFSTTLAFAGTLVLASLRNRAFYQFVAGMAGCFATTVWTSWLVPQTLSPSSGFIWLCIINLAIVLGFAIFDVFFGMKRVATENLTKFGSESPFEKFVSWGTLIIWFGLTCVAYSVELMQTTSPVMAMLQSPLGTTWMLLGLLTYTMQSPVRTPSIACHRIFGASLLVFLQFPCLLTNKLVNNLGFCEFVALILAAVASHAAVVGLAARAGHAPSTRRNGFGELVGRFFPIPYRLEAANCFANLVEVSVYSILVISVPLAAIATDSSSLRLLGLAVFMSGVGLAGAISVESVTRSPVRTRCIAIGIACWFVALLSWSSLPQAEIFQLVMPRAMRAASVLSIATVLLSVAYSFQFASESTWVDAMKQSWPVALGVSSFVALTATVMAWQQMDRREGVPSVAGEAIFLALTQIALAAVLVASALRNAWNILDFEPRQRAAYVYFAEAMAGIAAIGMYVVFPQWFNLPLKEYWPLIVLGVALISSAIAKLLSARKLDVLGDPISRTSLLLPLVAAIGVLVVGTSAPADLVMTLGAVYYFVLAAADGSRRLAILGMSLVNVALLLFWHRYPSLDFVRHPQLWLIPPALSVLLASYFHRRELSTATTTWIRYGALGTIFLSSTSEILLTGIGQSLWSPMLLTIFSVLAVLLGISLKTRSFVYFGFVFLLVSTTAMVAHAQQSLGHTWPWWALGITLGIVILVLFGLFEKKRNEMQQWTEKLRSWEA